MAEFLEKSGLWLPFTVTVMVSAAGLTIVCLAMALNLAYDLIGWGGPVIVVFALLWVIGYLVDPNRSSRPGPG